MPEYIELEALKEAFKSVTDDCTCPIHLAAEIDQILDQSPAADVAPVRHGKWEWSKDYDGDSILVCSECGRVCHEEDAPYCYCGAKMDLE